MKYSIGDAVSYTTGDGYVLSGEVVDREGADRERVAALTEYGKPSYLVRLLANGRLHWVSEPRLSPRKP